MRHDFISPASPPHTPPACTAGADRAAFAAFARYHAGRLTSMSVRLQFLATAADQPFITGRPRQFPRRTSIQCHHHWAQQRLGPDDE